MEPKVTADGKMAVTVPVRVVRARRGRLVVEHGGRRAEVREGAVLYVTGVVHLSAPGTG